MISLNKRKVVPLLALLPILLGVFPAQAQQKETPAAEAAIRKAGADYIKALRSHDMNAASAFWTPNGTYTDVAGSSTKARELLQKATAPGAASKAAVDDDLKIESTIHFTTKDVAIEEGTHESDGTVGRFTATWVKLGDRWLLDHLVEHASVPDQPTGRLAGLGWMIGNWLGESNGSTIRCSANWSENNKFIVRQFVVERDGKPVLSGHQRIGWHPGLKAIRSWSFDSDGGIVEGKWRQEGDAWVVRNSGVVADGSPLSSISFWLPEGENRCALRTSRVRADKDKFEEAIVEFNRLSPAS